MTNHVKMPLTTEAECAAAVAFNVGAVLDELGTVKALIAKLEAQEKMIAEALKATGAEKFSGNLFDASVSRSERTTIKTKELRADLGDDMLKDYLVTTTVTTLKLTAKK